MGPPRHLFRGPALLCFGAALQHHFTLNKTWFSIFIKADYGMWNDHGEQTTGLVAWDAEQPPMHRAPHTTLAAHLTVGQHKSTEDKVSLACMFLVGITERTCDQWKILAMTLWQLPYSLTVPLQRHSSGFLLCTLYPCSSCTGSVSSCSCNACCLYGLLSFPVCLSLHPGVISRCLFLQRLSDYLLLLFKLLLKAKRKKQDCQRRVV